MLARICRVSPDDHRPGKSNGNLSVFRSVVASNSGAVVLRREPQIEIETNKATGSQIKAAVLIAEYFLKQDGEILDM